MSQASYKLGVYESKYLIQLSGELRYTECSPFDSFLCKLREREQNVDILVDVTGAETIDSTNLGLIAELAAHVQEHFHHKLPIMSTNPTITRAIENMGLDIICMVIKDSSPSPESTTELAELNSEERNLKQIMLEAHEALMDLGESNRVAFGKSVELLKGTKDKEE